MLINTSIYIRKNLNNKLKTFRKHILESINFCLLSVDPFICVNNFLSLKENKLNIDNHILNLSNFENIYLAAFGKASIKMSLAIINKIKIKQGIISSNEEINSLQEKFEKIVNEYQHLKQTNLNHIKNINFNLNLTNENIYSNHIKNAKFNLNIIRENLKNIFYIKAGHPLPDQNSLLAGEKIIEIVQKVSENDLLFILISGGGSALAESPIVSIETLKALTSNLLKKGANITELNTIRKHLSKIKGGNLIKYCKGKIITCILSDVPGDPLDIIASGPTYFDNSYYIDALNILKKYKLENEFKDVKKIFEDGINGKISETLKEKEYNEIKSKEKIFNILVGSNQILCKWIINYLKEKKYNTIYLGSLIEGNVEDIAKEFAEFFKSIIKRKFDFYFTKNRNKYIFSNKMLNDLKFPLAFVWGGETTVIVKGNGKGGRNQHFVLSFLNNIKNIKEILYIEPDNLNIKQDSNQEINENLYLFSICSFGTDGIDGVSPAAGAIADSSTIEFIIKNNTDLNNILSNSDSFSFFESLGDAIITGPTGTNVTDVGILIIDRY